MSTATYPTQLNAEFSPVIREMLSTVPQITLDLWNDKYRNYLPDGSTDENTISESKARVVRGVYALDPLADVYAPLALEAMNNLLWNPGGRIHAGAGTDKRVTLINCYVNDDVADSMTSEDGHLGIMDALRSAALTQQMGGGIGTPFQSLRPNGALVKRTGSVSSGVIPFMRMWHAMCSTIMSSGSRRGAMMATLTDDHPDLFNPDLHTPDGRQKFLSLVEQYLSGAIRIEGVPVDFLTAKQIKNELSNFNVSVLISDEFMRAVEQDKEWDLGFNVPPANGKALASYTRHGNTWYVYRRVKAKVLWDAIMRSTYECAEPGVIFIDRVNRMNNLWYCEKINCTNPCGEQPLPPNGACNLGAVNYAMLVKDPFTTNAEINYELLAQTAAIGQRFLDNVLDVTHFPLPEQAQEARLKRRTGQGMLGLGTALQMMGVRYGSPLAVEITRSICKAHRDACYRASIELAKERGAFPLFDKDKYLQGEFIKKLPEDIRDGIAEFGIRNGVLMTSAPTGNTGIYYHNPSTSSESDFTLSHTRFVLQSDGSRKPYQIDTFGWRAYKTVMSLADDTKPEDVALPDYMVTALQLSVEDHVHMQAAVQEFIDASISKTVNCPESMSFEEFKHVYDLAYRLGLKGCTTYRPNATRGAVLVDNSKKPVEAQAKPKEEPQVKSRPSVLVGPTYKVPDGNSGNMFITVNIDPESKTVFEVFLRDNTGNEYVEHAGRNLSLLLRAGVPVKEIRQQLKRSGGQLTIWYDNKLFTSQLQLLDYVVFDQAAKYFSTLEIGAQDIPQTPATTRPVLDKVIAHGKPCPDCGEKLIQEGGCFKCSSCFYSKCN